jgi:hypothetical protein
MMEQLFGLVKASMDTQSAAQFPSTKWLERTYLALRTLPSQQIPPGPSSPYSAECHLQFRVPDTRAQSRPRKSQPLVVEEAYTSGHAARSLTTTLWRH